MATDLRMFLPRKGEMMDETISILYVEDDELMRAGMRFLLEKMPGIEVVAECGNGRDVLGLVLRLRPRVVILDIALPGLNGLEVAALLHREHANVAMIILTGFLETEYVRRAQSLGVFAYLLKDSSLAELEMAVRAAASGKSYVTSCVSKYLWENQRDTGAPLGTWEPITPRHREVLTLVAEGKTNKEIALVLAVSVKTIDKHRTELMRRLHIHNTAGLVRYATRNRFVTA